MYNNSVSSFGVEIIKYVKRILIIIIIKYTVSALSNYFYGFLDNYEYHKVFEADNYISKLKIVYFNSSKDLFFMSFVSCR